MVSGSELTRRRRGGLAEAALANEAPPAPGALLTDGGRCRPAAISPSADVTLLLSCIQLGRGACAVPRLLPTDGGLCSGAATSLPAETTLSLPRKKLYLRAPLAFVDCQLPCRIGDGACKGVPCALPCMASERGDCAGMIGSGGVGVGCTDSAGSTRVPFWLCRIFADLRRRHSSNTHKAQSTIKSMTPMTTATITPTGLLDSDGAGVLLRAAAAS